MEKNFNYGVARSESRPARTPVKAVRRHLGTNRADAHLYLVVAGPARPPKDTETLDLPPAPTPVCHMQEVAVWVFVLVLGLANLMAGCILWANTSGSL